MALLRNERYGVLRLRGGGGDGGATGAESRDCYLSMYAAKKNMAWDPHEERLARWHRCRLTGELLTEPVAMDELGCLYNKEALLMALATKTLPAAMSHISSLRDVITLRLTRSPPVVGPSPTPAEPSPFCCPLSGQAFNGKARFSAAWPSGHVFAASSLKTAPAAVEDALGAPVSSMDWIPLNAPADELESLMARGVARRAARRDRKRDKAGATANVDATPVASAPAPVTKEPVGGIAVAGGGKREREPPGVSASVSSVVAAVASRVAGSHDAARDSALAQSKRWKAGDAPPAGATPEVWASLFTSATVGARKETFGARNLSHHR